MLTLDAVRTAVLSDQPWTRLDELVRAEQAAGRKVKEIYAELVSIADEIDATPGLTEDGSDAFGDTLDALTGYCHRDYQYKDPPSTTLPSEEEIANLPRWACVAFAARCARRVLPLFESYWRECTTDDIRDVTEAINLAERAAATSLVRPTMRTAMMRAGEVGHRAAKVVYPSEASLHVAYAASGAAAAAAEAGRVRDPSDEPTDPMTVTFVFVRDALLEIGEHRQFVVIRRDFDHLARLAEWQNWTDDTPVPPEVFGPLWPEGPPKGWPPITDVPQRTDLAIEMFARERATEQMIEDDIVNLFNALNRYHIARSGVRLTLEQFRSLLPAYVPAEA